MLLIPDDPVFKSCFIPLEQPLFYSLQYWYTTELTDSQMATVRDAYDSWGEIEQMLPPRFRAQAPEADGEDDDYVLEGVAGQRLTRLYAVEAGDRVGRLEACYTMLRQAQLDRWPHPLADILREINALGSSPDRTDGVDLVDSLRRVLRVLSLQAPPHLLASIRQAAPSGPVKTIALNAEQEQEYRVYCEKVVHVLSAGDRFTYTTHRLLYPV
ncbi:hypothetical protein KBP30_41100 [Streptomyces sp. Go40/10]|uniref:hypothetical protein n=1 Tax=Streptomyces sp. Go40/10 TaxID=2825844 RepID=UPI001E4A2373|nr:hypothetical protein [Streptomyces sp. Go40/10]UFR07142.1 hypothetical protein KBP30_41100 [Streptomyces sp. Go40/10]